MLITLTTPLLERRTGRSGPEQMNLWPHGHSYSAPMNARSVTLGVAPGLFRRLLLSDDDSDVPFFLELVFESWREVTVFEEIIISHGIR